MQASKVICFGSFALTGDLIVEQKDAKELVVAFYDYNNTFMSFPASTLIVSHTPDSV